MHKSERLIQLMMMVNTRKSFTVEELASELSVSKRTIFRDLTSLGELGVPLYSVQGRGGGFRLLKERVLPPITFTESEAISVYFATQSLKYFGSLPFGDSAGSALEKFYHYLPADAKEQIDRLKDKVAIWSPNRNMSSASLQVLLQAVMTRSAVTIEYDSGNHEARERDVQPIGLYSDRGYWYCPAYCFAKQAYRLFRADRIRSAKLNGQVPYREDVDRKTIFDWKAEETESLEKTSFVVGLTPAGVRKLEPNGRLNGQILPQEDGGGMIRMTIPVVELEFYAEMIWGLGRDATILEPPEAVTFMKQNIDEIRKLYF